MIEKEIIPSRQKMLLFVKEGRRAGGERVGGRRGEYHEDDACTGHLGWHLGNSYH